MLGLEPAIGITDAAGSDKVFEVFATVKSSLGPTEVSLNDNGIILTAVGKACVAVAVRVQWRLNIIRLQFGRFLFVEKKMETKFTSVPPEMLNAFHDLSRAVDAATATLKGEGLEENITAQLALGEAGCMSVFGLVLVLVVGLVQY